MLPYGTKNKSRHWTEILDYILSFNSKSNQLQNKNNNQNHNFTKNLKIIGSRQNSHQQYKTNAEYKLEENFENFDKIKMAGDRNCLISTLLIYLNIEIQYTTILKSQMPKTEEDYDLEKEIFTFLNYQDNFYIAERI